ncbi:MAG: MarR family transcriptional regulator [Clostridia bacterium]|nr:MarR family transcriptional regulator [Clostridia bacterium]
MKKKNDEIVRRKPMEINEAGEVVFSCDKDKHPSEGRYKFDRPTPLMLCNEISKMFRNTLRNSSDDALIQGSYRDIVFNLAHGDGKTQLEIANNIHLKPPTVSVALTKLEDEGYVERKSDPMDARCTRVYLTDKGKSIHDRAHVAIDTLESNATKGLSEDEVKQLTLLLYKVRENIADDN